MQRQDTAPRAARDAPRSRHAPAILLLLLALTSVAVLRLADRQSPLPALWPAPGLLLGAVLLAQSRFRPWVAGAGTVLLVLAHVVTGYSAVMSIGLPAATLAAVGVAHHRLRRGLDGRRIGLLEEGDVWRLVAASAQGAAAAALVGAATVALDGDRSFLLAAVAVWSTHAAALLVLVPLFVASPQFAAVAPRGERVTQSMIVVGCTIAIVAYAPAPPLLFAVMPMFAWLAYRGTLREASLLLAAVASIASGATLLGFGPVHELGTRYGLAPELVVGFLQLFILDCALLLLPLSVMTTQQRMSAASAAAGQRTLQRLVDAATDTAVISTDLDGRVELFNPGAVTMFGRDAATMTGQSVDRLFTDVELHRQAARLGTTPVFAAVCAAAVVSGEVRQPWTVIRPDGEERTVLLTLNPVSGEDDEPTGYLCVGDDVTEREAVHRAALTALEHERRAVQQLTELERIKGDFVATVSHELRTPLTSMLGYLELLQDGHFGDLNDAQGAVTGRVERNSRRLLLLVEDLLLLSQVEARELRLMPVRTDLRDTARAALEALAPLRADRDLEVAVQLPERPALLVADPVQLERVLVNLLSNAVKFTPDHGRVDLVVEDGEDEVVVLVRDTGLGIPEAEQPQLFTRFFRSSTANARAIQGTGLGLAIAQAIVQRHEGDIEVTSREGVGTCVTLRLPKGPYTERADELAGRPRRSTSSRKVRAPQGEVVGNTHPG